MRIPYHGSICPFAGEIADVSSPSRGYCLMHAFAITADESLAIGSEIELRVSQTSS